MNNLKTIYLAHITKDVPEGQNWNTTRGILGGMGPYGITANVRTLPSGLEAPMLITKVGWDEPMLHDLMQLGEREQFDVVNIAPEEFRYGITTYDNRYDEQRRRTQLRYTTSPAFDEKDLDVISHYVDSEGANFVLGTVTGWGEMNPEFLEGIRRMKGKGLISAATQGWHRHVDENFQVHQFPIPDELMDGMFGGIDICVMSDEDIAFGAKDEDGNAIPDERYMKEISRRTENFILTQGANGAHVFNKGKYKATIDSFPLTEAELSRSNPTGLGDTFCAIATREIARGVDIATSLSMAHLVTAAKLAEGGPGTIKCRGEGMSSLLTTAQLREFSLFVDSQDKYHNRRERVQNYARYMEYMHNADLTSLLLNDYGIDIEGQHTIIEGQPSPQSRK